MKRFRFRLDPFLKYREFIERKAQQEMAAAQKAVSDCEDQIAQSRRHLSETLEILDQEMNAGIDADRYHAYDSYISGIEVLIDSESQRLQQLMRELEQKRKLLAQKAIEKKVIANLKERQKQAYYDHMLKMLQKETDDTVIVRQARKLQQ